LCAKRLSTFPGGFLQNLDRCVWLEIIANVAAC